MKTFFERWKPVFEIVCRILGNGWRVNMLDDCDCRLKLTSPQFKNYSVHVRPEKGRLNVSGSVESRHWRSPGHTCTFSLHRNPVEIAAELERKILVEALSDIEKAQEYEKETFSKREEIKIIKGMLSRLVHLNSYYGKLSGFKADNGLTGYISKGGNGFDISVQGLSIGQLVKLTGFVK